MDERKKEGNLIENITLDRCIDDNKIIPFVRFVRKKMQMKGVK